jgi:hypothetical protein
MRPIYRLLWLVIRQVKGFMHFDTGGHLIIAYKGVHKLDDVEK